MENSSFSNGSSLKNGVKASQFEIEGHDRYLHGQVKTLRAIDAARLAITTFALLCGLTILGISADALSVYNATSMADAGWLSIWPASFDLRPAVALLVGSIFVTLASIAGLVCSKVPHIRKNTPLHTPVMFAAPLIGFIVSLVAIILFYAVNASTTTDTLLSWTCRWKALPMTTQPYFGTLCSASWASVYLAVILVPVEAICLCAAAWQLKVERHVAGYVRASRKGSRSPPGGEA